MRQNCINLIFRYSNMNLIDFMSLIGRRIRVGAMLKRQMVRDRMEDGGLPLNEFVYQVKNVEILQS